eukprot:3013641-Pleurochrysis_carterae.AAC.1
MHKQRASKSNDATSKHESLRRRVYRKYFEVSRSKQSLANLSSAAASAVGPARLADEEAPNLALPHTRSMDTRARARTHNVRPFAQLQVCVRARSSCVRAD